MRFGTIDAVLTGRVDAYGPGERRSAIRKEPSQTPRRVSAEGVEGDEHGDTLHHGGPEQAVHHYSFDNYAYWRQQFPDRAERFSTPGFFGENLSSAGFAEPEVCVGDTFRIGTATLQVSQARQPCWKLARRAGVDDFALHVQSGLRTGWFYRVLEPGLIAPGDSMTLLDRPNPQWSLERLLRVTYLTPLDLDELRLLEALPGLSPGWSRIATARLAGKTVESWTGRVTIPTD